MHQGNWCSSCRVGSFHSFNDLGGGLRPLICFWNISQSGSKRNSDLDSSFVSFFFLFRKYYSTMSAVWAPACCSSVLSSNAVANRFGKDVKDMKRSLWTIVYMCLPCQGLRLKPLVSWCHLTKWNTVKWCIFTRWTITICFKFYSLQMTTLSDFCPLYCDRCNILVYNVKYD